MGKSKDLTKFWFLKLPLSSLMSLLLLVLFPSTAVALKFELCFGSGANSDEIAAITYAANRWESWLANTGSGDANTVELSFNFVPLASDVLGQAHISWWQSADGVALTPAQYMMRTGNDLYGEDGSINFNSSFNWYTSTNGRPGSQQYDLATVALHEIGHQLGLTSSYDGVSWGQTDSGFGIIPRLTRWDTLLLDQNNNVPIAYPNINLFDETGTVNFIGPNAIYAYGAPVPVYSPNLYKEGSSLCHVNAFNSLMNYSTAPGVATHGLYDYEVGVFTDLGWTLSTPTSVHASGSKTAAEWNDGSAWDGGLPPAPSTDVSLGSDFTQYSITVERKNVRAASLSISGSFWAPPKLEVRSGKTLTISGDTMIGRDVATTGTLVVDGDNSTFSTGSLYVGGDNTTANGLGNVFIQNGGQVSIGNMLKIWNGGTVDLEDGTLTFNSGGSISNSGLFRKSGGTGTSTLTNTGFINTGGTVEVDSGTLEINSDYFHGSSFTDSNFTFANGGMARFIGGWHFYMNGTTTGSGDGTLEVAAGNLAGNNTAVLNFAGSSKVKLNGGTVGSDADRGGVINAGNFEYASGTIYRMSNSGTLTHPSDGTMSVGTLTNLPGGLVDIQGNGGINGNGAIINSGLFRKSGGTGTSTLTNTGFINTGGTVEVDSGTLIFQSSYTQTVGETNLNGGNLAFNIADIEGGELTGNGTIAGTILNNGGVVSPGHSLGVITLNGNYTQGHAGSLLIELAGLDPAQFDFLDVNGTATLDGTLELSFLNGFHPALGDTFHILDFYSHTEDFDSIQVLGLGSGYQFTSLYSASGLTLVTEAIPEPTCLSFILFGLMVLRRKHLRKRCGKTLH